MSKYILVEGRYGDLALAKRTEDGTYATIDLEDKATLVALLVDLANDGSELTSVGAVAEPELTLEQRIERLRKWGYEIDEVDLKYPDNTAQHRDAMIGDDNPVCMYGTLEAFVTEVEEYHGDI